MKKFVSIIAILLMLSLAACSNQDTPSAADNPSNTQTESNTMLDAGVWPVNEYTEGLPVPSGTVGWAMLDTEHENCSISIVDISETDYNDYLELLKQEGFSIIEEVSEEIEGQDYVSIGTLLSNGEKGLSISYIPDNFTIYMEMKIEYRPSCNATDFLKVRGVFFAPIFGRPHIPVVVESDGEICPKRSCVP